MNMQRPVICLLTATLVTATSCAEWTEVASLSPLDASAQQQAEAERRGQPVEISNSLGMKFVLIPPGQFVMGSPDDERGRQAGETQHSVTLTRPFYCGITEVTQAQWTALMGDNPSFVEGDQHPVHLLCHVKRKDHAELRLV